MDEWGVFGVIVSLLGFIGTAYIMFYKPMHQLNIQLVKMNLNFEHMREGDNIRDKRIGRHSEKIDDHEKRIGKLEIVNAITDDNK